MKLIFGSVIFLKMGVCFFRIPYHAVLLGRPVVCVKGATLEYIACKNDWNTCGTYFDFLATKIAFFSLQRNFENIQGVPIKPHDKEFWKNKHPFSKKLQSQK